MNLINLLTELAHTSVEQKKLNQLLASQPDTIQQAFLTQNAAAIKQQLMKHQNETFSNERTVALI